MGMVYIYALENGKWRKKQAVAPNYHTEGIQFGISLDLDDEILCVGAWYQSSATVKDCGAIYFLEKDPQGFGVNGIEGPFFLPDPQKLDEGGRSIARLHDFVVTSARGRSKKGSPLQGKQAGAVFIGDLENIPASFREFTPPVEDGDMYGQPIVLNDRFMCIGAMQGNEVNPVGTGYVDVFCTPGSYEQGSKNQLIPLKRITPPNGELKESGYGACKGDGFGRSLALSGSTLAVGAYRSTHGGIQQCGGVFIYDLEM